MDISVANLIAKFARKLHLFLSRIYGLSCRYLGFYRFLPPSKIHIIFTSKCNLDCNFCYVGKNLNQPEPNKLGLDEWDKIVNKSSPLSVFIFSGGEPFANRDIYPVVNKFLDKKRLVSITTNGTIINLDKLRPLVQKNLFFIMISVHGLEKTHDEIVRRPGSFKKLVDNIKAIDKLKKELGVEKPLISIKSVISPDNYKEIPQLIEYIEQHLPVHHIYFNLMAGDTLHHSLDFITDINDPRYSQGSLYNYPEDIRDGILETIDFILNKKKTSHLDIGFTDDFQSDNDLRNFIKNSHDYKVNPCNRPWHEALLYNNGDSSSCLGFKGANIKDVDYNINKLLRTPEYKPFFNFINKSKGDSIPCTGCKEAAFKKKSY